MYPISVVIITFNEERNIARCLQTALKITDDVVVWDSFSTDQTKSICDQYPVRFFQFPWEGYSISKNKANAQAKYDWIISLDADEALSIELIQSIEEMKVNGMFPASFARLTNYCGNWIRHCGWYPDIKWRIFNRHEVAWKGVIHESLMSIDENRTILPKRIKGDCLHYSYYSKEDHYRQADKFVKIMAQEKVDAGRRTIWIMRFLSPLSKFFQMYIIKGGILDGGPGLKVCRISAWAAYKKYQYWYLLQREIK
jgi:glycosyltransferase involved in cell wall biosynthesis